MNTNLTSVRSRSSQDFSRTAQTTKPIKPNIPAVRLAVLSTGIETLQLMKTKLTTLKFLVILCSLLATTAAFGQTTTWTGGGDGVDLGSSLNWGGLAPGSGFIGEWDGLTTSNLFLTYANGVDGNPFNPVGGGFGSVGASFSLTTNQINSVNIRSAISGSQNLAIDGITIASGAGAFSLGDGSANVLNIVTRSAASNLQNYMNDSANAATIYPNVRWQSGGGVQHTLTFGGAGNWMVNNYLVNANGAANLITKNDSGTLTWTGVSVPGSVGNGLIWTPFTLNGGTVVLKSSDLLSFQNIANNGTLLQYDAPSQSQTLSGVISGTGALKVSSGTLTLSGQNTYTGNTELANNGTLIAGAFENSGTSGPLGVGGTISFTGGALGFSVNNTFDYSSRFSTSANQVYKIDTAGQNVTFATGLSSSGGTLAKIGSGTLTLSGASSYSGLTTVSAGKLVFQGLKSGSGNITVANGTALGVTTTGTQGTPGTLTLGTSSGVTLEFNSVSSTTTALLAAGTLSSVGTVTINVNSGMFAVGQSYPLLAWTSGSAPKVSLGSVSGAVGNLTTNGNTIKLNVTGLAYVWSGVNNGNWDTTTANNWMLGGSPATFANGVPALFDDSATGMTSVTLNGVLQPLGVAINNSSLTYSISSSTGNDIGGSGGLTKSGGGTLTLSGGANAYTGRTTISGGRLSVGTLANGGSPSDIGTASSSATNLVLNGGTLQYTGGAASIDRLFTLGTAGGTIDASGSGALNLNNAGPVGLGDVGPRGLTLTGSSADTNTLAAALADNGGVTSLAKLGTGTWILAGNNTYSGATTISGGALQVGSGGATGALGTGNVVINNFGASLIFNRSGTLTVGPVSGFGSVVQNGSGTVILSGDNTHFNGTTINSGTVQVGNGGPTGSLSSFSGVVDNSTLIFNSTGTFNYGGVVSGTGQLIKRGSGLLKLLGANTYTGGTTIDPGAALQVGYGNGGSIVGDVTNNGTLITVRQDYGVLIFNGTISGTGSLVKDLNNVQSQGDVSLYGNNTYTGGTVILGGTLIVGDGNTSGSIVGNVLFTNNTSGAISALLFNRADTVTFGGVIGGYGFLTQQGSGTLTLTGNNTHNYYTGSTTISAGTLQLGNGGTSGSVVGNVTDNGTLVFNRLDNMTFGGVISGTGSVVQNGSGTVTLTGANSYAGATTVGNGTLVVNSVPGALNVSGGTLAPGGIGSVGTLTVGGNVTISSGAVLVSLNKSSSPSNSFVSVTGTINYSGGTLKLDNFGPNLVVGDKFTIFNTPVIGGGSMTIVSPGGYTFLNNLGLDGSVTVASVTPPGANKITFTRAGGNLNLSWSLAFKGLHLQVQTNSLAVGLRNNWVTIPGTDSVTNYSSTLDKLNGSVFYRLAP